MGLINTLPGIEEVEWAQLGGLGAALVMESLQRALSNKMH